MVASRTLSNSGAAVSNSTSVRFEVVGADQLKAWRVKPDGSEEDFGKGRIDWSKRQAILDLKWSFTNVPPEENYYKQALTMNFDTKWKAFAGSVKQNPPYEGIFNISGSSSDALVLCAR